jgi:hypothetical protein
VPPFADIEDSRARDRRLCRPGWHRAWATALAIVAALAVLGRMTPPEEPATVRRTPHWTWILPGSPAEAALSDVRALRTPTAFALPTAAGFTSALRARMPRLAPPMRRAAAAIAAAASLPPAAPLPDWTSPDFAVRTPLPRHGTGWKPVFANRRPPPDRPRMDFPPGWEPRIFSGLDLAYPDWVPGSPWTASADILFDAKGIPVSVLLDRSSGIPDVDRQLARSAAAWRLLDPDAPRHGTVVWRVPAVPAPATEPDSPASGEDIP